MSLSTRYCTDDYEVKEDFIGIYECREGVKTDALFEYIKDISSIVGTVRALFLRVRKGAEGALINIHTNEGA